MNNWKRKISAELRFRLSADDQPIRVWMMAIQSNVCCREAYCDYIKCDCVGSDLLVFFSRLSMIFDVMQLLGWEVFPTMSSKIWCTPMDFQVTTHLANRARLGFTWK
ncbi:hypothetical protein TNCV_3969981 [Trichonephila clavipes]|nr:hypothetical protein TNCV_3969981 [Trichonephila clavipes]